MIEQKDQRPATGDRRGKWRRSDEEQNYNLQLGRRIERVRRMRCMTRTALAAAIDVSDKQLFRWEVGECRIPPFYLDAICALLNVSVAHLARSGRGGGSV